MSSDIVDAYTLTQALWAEGVDTDFIVDTDNEVVALEASCYGRRIRLYHVWGDTDEFFMDVGDISIYEHVEGEGFVFLGESSAETVDTLAEEVTERLAGM